MAVEGDPTHAAYLQGRWRWLIALWHLLAAVLIFGNLEARAAEPTVGMVTRVENEAEVVSNGSSSTALVGTVLHLKDQVRTGAGSRLQVTFRDNTILTLGEKATVTIDRYVFDPDQSVGEAAIDASQGAIRFATGRLQAMQQKSITVSTPVAALGVRGTEFWTGLINRVQGVLLLQPQVAVTNQAGSVVLTTAGQGTFIKSLLTAPDKPTIWPATLVAQALAMTNPQAPGGPQNNSPNNQPKGGQNGAPNLNPRYALSPPVILGLGLVFAGGTFFAITQVDDEEDGPSSP